MPNEQNIFQYNKPTEKQTEALKTLREGCEKLHQLMLEVLPPGRYRSIAITKLEEVSMFQNKACVFELPAE